MLVRRYLVILLLPIVLILAWILVRLRPAAAGLALLAFVVMQLALSATGNARRHATGLRDTLANLERSHRPDTDAIVALNELGAEAMRLYLPQATAPEAIIPEMKMAADAASLAHRAAGGRERIWAFAVDRYRPLLDEPDWRAAMGEPFAAFQVLDKRIELRGYRMRP